MIFKNPVSQNLVFNDFIQFSEVYSEPYSQFIWSVFSRIRAEYRKYGPEKLRIRTLFTQCYQ